MTFDRVDLGENVALYRGDCLDVMAELPDNSVDTIITDPPYGLEFMGKDWDHGVPGVRYWKAALRVAKPGAILLAFGGTRTHHRLMCAIEDAGWIIRDVMSWLYGSGFPKSHDISKAIDKAAGATREVVGPSPHHSPGRTSDGTRNSLRQLYRGNGDGKYIAAPATPDAQLWDGWGTALKPAWEPIIVAMAPLDGTFAQNAEKWGVAGMWIDGGRVGIETIKVNGWKCGGEQIYNGRQQLGYDGGIHQGRWPANLILDPEAGALLDEQSGERAPGHYPSSRGNGGLGCTGHQGQDALDERYTQVSGASRFFMRIEHDTVCALCDLPITPNRGIMSETIEEASPCKSTFASSAGRSLRAIQATIESIAPGNAPQELVVKIAQSVPYAESLCDSCATRIALGLVATRLLGSNHGELQAILGSITSYKRCILIQNLVSFAELWENTGTIPTIASLSILCGSVLHAITSYTPETRRSEPSRFRYCPKASRAERNAGLEGMEKRHRHTLSDYRKPSEGRTAPKATGAPQQNHHPTVKPLALMEYLCKLTKTPTGGVVLDPFMGSGTTGVAAVKTGRAFIGIELKQEYLDIARARIQAAMDEMVQDSFV